jgi:hypothetical protein
LWILNMVMCSGPGSDRGVVRAGFLHFFNHLRPPLAG